MSELKERIKSLTEQVDGMLSSIRASLGEEQKHETIEKETPAVENQVEEDVFEEAAKEENIPDQENKEEKSTSEQASENIQESAQINRLL
ncbi:unnamed protein product [Oikopleura dioica]|uniref:Uncharacterized protein n=1 Tax=Oikopleura dioica TaxID=34765 RepID=E4YZH8_OIKDI|nr:unnamed protein product [Oikopleura dioica]